jgi:hypothetical protein
VIVQQNAFVLFLLLLQDPDLLLGVFDSFPELLVDTTCQTRDKGDPQLLFHDQVRLTDGRVVGTRFRMEMAFADQRYSGQDNVYTLREIWLLDFRL